MLALTWSTPAGDVVRETAVLTDRPFGGNLILNTDQHRRLDEALEAGPRIVSLFWGDPAGYVERVHDANGVVLHTVSSAEEARRAVASGVDVVVAQRLGGWRARAKPGGDASLGACRRGRGGTGASHRGRWDRRRPRRGRRARSRCASGAAGHPVLAQETPIHEEYRRRVTGAAETDAQWYADLYDVGWPDAPHRALRTSTAEMWEAAGRPPSGSRPGEGEVIAHFAPTTRSSGTRLRRRWSGPPVISRRSPCGPNRASRWPGSHNQQQRSWPNSSPVVSEAGMPLADLSNFEWKLQLGHTGAPPGASDLLKIWSTG